MAATENSELCAAAVTIDITPPVGYQLGGYGNRTSASNDLHDPLRGRLLLLDNGKTRLAIITLDLLTIFWENAQAIRAALKEVAQVPEEHTFINYSHTHAGPDVKLYECYLSQVVEKLRGAAIMATNRLEPAEIIYGEDEIEFNVNRRRKDAEGNVRMAPNPEGIVDHRVRVLRVDTATARPAAVLFHAVVHANALRADSLTISADFPGAAQNLVEAAFGPACTPMFMQGCTGNIRPNITNGYDFRGGDEEDLRWCGYSLGAAAIKAATRSGTRDRRANSALGTELAGAEVILELEGRDGGKKPYPIQAVRIGNLVIIGLPGEPVVEYALQLESNSSGWDQVLVAGYCNARTGYLATASHYAEGGYEATAPASPYTAAAEPVVLQAAQKLADSLREE